MQAFLEHHLKVFQNEYKKLLWISLVCFSLFFVTALFRNFVDTTFLKRYGAETIPMMLVINATITVIFFAFTDRLLKIYSDRIILAFFLILCAILAQIFNHLITTGSNLVYPFIYQLMLLIDSVLFVHIWNMAGDMFNARQGKRIFPLITASQLFGSIFGSFSTSAVVVIPGENSILVIFGVIYSLVAIYMLKTGSEALGNSEKRPKEGQTSYSKVKLLEVPKLMKKYPVIKFLIITGLIPNIILPIFFFQFSTIASSSFADEHSLITFFSIFRGFTTLATFLALFWVRDLLTRIGLPNASLVFPLNFALVFAALPALFNIFVAGYGQFSSIMIQKAVAGPVNKILYSIIPFHLQTWSRTFIRGSVLKIGIFTGSTFMLFSKSYLDARDLSYVGLFLSLVLLTQTLQFRSEYKHVLKQVLTNEGNFIEASGPDAPIPFGHFSTNIGVTHHPVEIQPVSLADGNAPVMNTDEALKLLSDESEILRIQAASYFAKHHDFKAVRSLVLLLSNQDDRVRNASIDALRRYPKSILPYLEASLLTMDLRGKQGILEVIRLSYSITEFENTALFRKLITEAYTNLIYIRRIQSSRNDPIAKMLIKHIEENNEEILRLIFYGLWTSHSDMSLLYDAIKTDKAAIAVELMESTVRRDIVPYLIPLLEDIPIDRKIEIGRSMLLLPREDTIIRSLTLLAQAEDPLTRLLAVMAIGAFGIDDAIIPVLEARLFDEHPGVIHAARTLLNDSSFEEEKTINPAELIEKFRIFPIFEGMTIRELFALATVAEIRNFGTEETILHEGSENCPIYLIYSGTVNVYNNYGATEQTLKVSLGPGSFVGSVDVFTNLPVEATSVAAKPTQTFLFPRAEFQEIIRLYPQITANMCKFCDLKSEQFYGV